MKEQLNAISAMLQQQFHQKPSLPPPSKSHKSYNFLQNQNRVLLYQLRIYKKVMDLLSLNLTQQQSQFLQTSAKKEVDQEILAHNLEMLQKSEEEARKQSMKNKDKLIEIQSERDSKDRYLRILEQKCNQFQRLGGHQKIKDLKKENDQLRKQRQSFDEKLNEQKQRSKMYMEKCKILENLNKQTQNQLAEFMVSGTQKASRENNQNFSNIELLAAKQQIKQLKNTIETLKLQKQQIIRKHSQKEALYSRMMDKNEEMMDKRGQQNQKASNQRVSRQKIR